MACLKGGVFLFAETLLRGLSITISDSDPIAMNESFMTQLFMSKSVFFLRSAHTVTDSVKQKSKLEELAKVFDLTDSLGIQR